MPSLLKSLIGKAVLLGKRYSPQGAPEIGFAGDVDFGSTPDGTPVSEIYTITNTGTSDLIITAINVPAGFTLTDPVLPITIEPGNNDTFTIEADADTVGTFAGDVTIVSNTDDYVFGITVTIAIAINFLIRDDFTTDDANPVASPRLSEPGSGRMIVDTDTGNHLSIAGGNLVAGGSVAAANPRVHWENTDGTSPAWAAGAIVTYKINSESSDFIGVENIAGGTPDIYYRWGAVNNINYAASAVAVTLPTLPAHALFVLDTSRVLFYSRSNAGVLKLHWVGVITPPATIVPTVSSGALSLTNVRLATIPAVNIAPQIAVVAPVVNTGSIAPGTEDALTSGDFYLQVTITSEPTVGNNDFHFRVQDANNYWLRRITTTGAVELYEVVAGVATLRDSSAAAFAAGEKCTITADDETIRIFANTTLKITYASAANFKTATGWTYAAIGTNGDEDNLEVWDRYAAGAYLTALDAVCL